jgi:predicted nuclease of predicted toxin-antitoxin system
MKLLVDHDIEGCAVLLWGSLIAGGWLELVEIDFVMFTTVDLAFDCNDRNVWRFAQANGMVVLTSNRNMQDDHSLEQTIRQENTKDSLPIITISDVQCLDKKSYRDRCIARLVEIALDLDNYLGTGRIFVP